MPDNRSKTPRPAVMDVGTFRERFGTDGACWEHLRNVRWGPDLERFTCPDCGHARGWWLANRRLVECSECHRQTSVTAGTVFHGARVPLWKWFWAIYQLAQDKKGVAALTLAKQIGVCYEHEPIITGSGREAVRTFPWIHTFIGNMKRMILGTHHWVSPKHVDDYLAEFTYRANRRWLEAGLFDRLVVAALSCKAVTYKDLTTGAT